MLTAIVLALASALLAAAARPPMINDDLLNEVKWPTTHDYEVHDRDADRENQRQDEERLAVLVPSIAKEVQDHQARKTADRGHQVSVEVNGNSGFVDRSLEISSPVSFVNEEEIMHHGDFDRVKSKPRVFQERKQLNGDGGFVNEAIGHIPLKKSAEEKIKEGVLEVQSDSKGLSNSDEQQIPVSVVFFDGDEEDSLVDSEDSVNDKSNSNARNLGSDSEALKSDDAVISESKTSNDNINVKIYHNDELKNVFLQNTTTMESDHLSDNPSFEKATSFLTNPQPVVLQEEVHEPHLLSTTVANTPLVKVHLLEDSPRKKQNSRKGLRRNKVNEPKDSPITHISTESPDLNPPRLVKDGIPKPARRRVLVELKIRPKSEDSAVSSTTESLSTADLDDKIYDEEEEEDDDGDLENTPQDQVINPIKPQEPVQEDLFIHGPLPAEGVPIVPAHLPLPEDAPSKIHQPVLHHIVHALLSPPDPEDEDYHEDAFLSRYSPNFVPYPAYLGIPF